MKKASASFLVVFFAAMLVSFQSFAQHHYPQPQNEVLNEAINQNLRSHERLKLADLLRLSRQEQNSMQIISLSIMAQHLGQGQAQLEFSQLGRPIATEVVRKQLREIKVSLPVGTMMEGLELSSQSEIYLQSITAEVSRLRMPNPGPGPGPGPGQIQQVSPNAMLTLQLNQHVRGMAQIPLKQLVRQQYGLSIEGAEIQRVIVEGDPMPGRAASVQVEINNRLVGPLKYLSLAQKRTPLPINSMEEVRTLQLVVNGDAIIQSISIRFGQVRPAGPQIPQMQRIYVGQEVSYRMPLELYRLLAYDSRMIRSITIEARGSRYAQASLELAGIYGQVQGTIFVGANPMRATLQLIRPMPAHELRLQSVSPVMIEALEIEFEQYPRY
jgi:hypothetical protein